MRVRLSADVLKSDLVRRIEEISGQDLLACHQCGECSAGCPVAFAMDMLPSQVIRLVQLGESVVLMLTQAYGASADCTRRRVPYSKGPLDVNSRKISGASSDDHQSSRDHFELPCQLCAHLRYEPLPVWSASELSLDRTSLPLGKRTPSS